MKELKDITLFDRSSTSVQSATFLLPAGYVAIINGFNFPAKNESDKCKCVAFINKVLFAEGMFPNKHCCDTGIISNPPKILQSEPVNQNGYWNINHDQNTVALTLPGAYSVELSCPELLSSVSVVVQFISAEHASLVPKDIIIGNLSCCKSE